MNQQIVDYLRENKGRYREDDLVKALRRQGYADADIESARQQIYVAVHTNTPTPRFIATAIVLVANILIWPFLGIPGVEDVLLSFLVNPFLALSFNGFFYVWGSILSQKSDKKAEFGKGLKKGVLYSFIGYLALFPCIAIYNFFH